MGEVPLVDRRRAAPRPRHRRGHHGRPGGRAVRALGHCGRLPDHRPGAVVGARVLHLTMTAFDLAERFRCPVFLLTDKELNMTMTTVAVDDYVPGRGAAARSGPGAGHALPVHPGRPRCRPSREYGSGETVRFTGSTPRRARLHHQEPRPRWALSTEHLAAKIDDHRDEIELADRRSRPRGHDAVRQLRDHRRGGARGGAPGAGGRARRSPP